MNEVITKPELPEADSAPEIDPVFADRQASLVASQALDLLRAWTASDPTEADELRAVFAVDTVLLVHKLAREKVEGK